MDLTKQEAIRLHREMWRRISEMSDEEIKECTFYIKGKHSRMMRIKSFILKNMDVPRMEVVNSCF